MPTYPSRWLFSVATALCAADLADRATAHPGVCCAAGGTCRAVTDVASCTGGELAMPDATCFVNPCPQSSPANATCATARVLPGGALGRYYGTTIGAGSQLPSSGCSEGSADPIDVWFRFTNTRPFETVFNFNTEGTPDQNGNGGDTTLEIFDACPSAGGESLACDNDSGGNGRSRITLLLLEGEGVRIRVAFRGGGSGMFRLNISDEVAPPPNDACASAVVIPTSPSQTTGDNSRATGADLTPCGANDERDVWFSFTPAVGGLYRFDTLGSSGNSDTTLAVFEGCPLSNTPPVSPEWPPNLLACNDDLDPATGRTESMVKVVLEAGTAYKARVSGFNNTQGAFSLNLSGPFPLPPVPVIGCDGARQVLGAFNGSIYTGGDRPRSPAGACNSGPARIEGVLDNALAFTFIPAGDGTLSGTIDCASGDVRFDGLVYLLRGPCGGPYSELACLGHGGPFDLAALPPVLAGERYFLVVGDAGIFDGGGDVSVNITVPGGAAMGACCAGAVCSLTTPELCDDPLSRFSGVGSSCNAFPVNVTVPCCLADFNKNAAGVLVTVQDIFDFLTAYFAGDPRANINGSGPPGAPTLTVQDIFDYLAVYFFGCP
ncbi:MAG: GC-type dockerin domain-anchored protein [Phycisphaerales bacterium]